MERCLLIEKAAVSIGNHGDDVDSGKGKVGSTRVNVGHRRVTVSTGTKKKGKTTVDVGPNFIYQYAATETQIHDNCDVVVFFLMNDLRPGTLMKLHFTRTSPVTAFLPRSLAKILPFSLKKLPKILSVFSIRSNYVKAEAPHELYSPHSHTRSVALSEVQEEEDRETTEDLFTSFTRTLRTFTLGLFKEKTRKKEYNGNNCMWAPYPSFQFNPRNYSNILLCNLSLTSL